MVANAKHQQNTSNKQWTFFPSFWNISDKNREKYDLKKHHGQHIWNGNRLRLIVRKNKPRNTHVFETTAGLNRVLDETKTARTRVWASCAHASLWKFTSGSRRSLSRPRILRSLIIRVEPHKSKIPSAVLTLLRRPTKLYDAHSYCLFKNNNINNNNFDDDNDLIVLLAKVVLSRLVGFY